MKVKRKLMYFKFLHVGTDGTVTIMLGDVPEGKADITSEVKLSSVEFEEQLLELADKHPEMLRRALESALEKRLVDAIAERIRAEL